MSVPRDKKRNHNMSEPIMRNVTRHLPLGRIKIEMHQDVGDEFIHVLKTLS